MADNLQLNVGTGGAVLATDDVSSVHYQIIKVAFGALDAVTLVTPSAGFPVNIVAASPVPVTQSGSWIIGANSGVDIGDVTINNAPGAAAVNVQDGGNSITVDNAGTFATQASQAGTWNITNISGTVSLPTGAATLAEQQSQTTSLQLIDDAVHAPNAAVNKSMAIGGQLDDTATVVATENNVSVARITAQRAIHVNLRDVAGAEITNLATTPGGNVAHDATDSGNPIKIGGQARTTLPAAVADTDRANIMTDDLGRIVTYPMVPRDLVDQNRIVLTTTTETTLLTGVASTFLDLVSLDISNESATEVRIDIRDATAGTVRWSIDLAADGGGIAKTFTVPWKQSTVNANWTAQLSAAVSSVYISVQAVRNN